MSKHKRLAQELFDARWFPDTAADVSLRHFQKEDVLALLDRRTGERREREWQGFRNYLYGWNCPILAECAGPDYAVMLIDASWDMQQRLADEFSHLRHYAAPETAHNIWGEVFVENGKPIGRHVKGELVRQPVDKHWTKLD